MHGVFVNINKECYKFGACVLVSIKGNIFKFVFHS